MVCRKTLVHNPIKVVGILGGDGFIGHNLYHDLKNYFCCIPISRNNYEECKSQFYDIFINANGNSNKILACTDPLVDFDATVRACLSSLVDFNYNHYIHVSSCEVYSDMSEQEKTSEDSVVDVAKISKYALSKYLAECLVKNHCEHWNILRLSTPAGPGLKKGPIYDIMYGNRLWVSAASFLQILHTKFVSEFIVNLLNNGIMNETINLVAANSISLNEVMTVLDRRIESPYEPFVLHNINNDKARKIFNLPPSLDSVIELRRTL